MAAPALLRLLGYDVSALTGTYPDAQLAKAEAVVDASGTALKSLSTKTLAGSFNAAADHFAGYALAEGVEILDTDGAGGYALADNRKYLLDENVQVLLRQGTDYYPTTLDQVDDESYSLTGWYDDLDLPAGGRVRILIATAY